MTTTRASTTVLLSGYNVLMFFFLFVAHLSVFLINTKYNLYPLQLTIWSGNILCMVKKKISVLL